MKLFLHTVQNILGILSSSSRWAWFLLFSLVHKLALKSRMAQFVLPRFAFTLQGVQDGPSRSQPCKQWHNSRRTQCSPVALQKIQAHRRTRHRGRFDAHWIGYHDVSPAHDDMSGTDVTLPVSPSHPLESSQESTCCHMWVTGSVNKFSDGTVFFIP